MCEYGKKGVCFSASWDIFSHNSHNKHGLKMTNLSDFFPSIFDLKTLQQQTFLRGYHVFRHCQVALVMKLKAICPAMLGIPGYSTLAPDGLHAFLRWDVASWLRAEQKVNNSKTSKSLTYIPPNGKVENHQLKKGLARRILWSLPCRLHQPLLNGGPSTNMQGSTQHLSDGHTRDILLLKVRSACIVVSNSIQQLQQTHGKTSSL